MAFLFKSGIGIDIAGTDEAFQRRIEQSGIDGHRVRGTAHRPSLVKLPRQAAIASFRSF